MSNIIDLSTLSAAQGFIIQGDAAGDRAGYSVSDAGDVNGDGIADFIVGAVFGDDGGDRAGEAYVIYGKVGVTRGTVDLTNLAASDGFIIQGDTADDWAGYSVSSAGDVNGDGIDDLIVGAPYGDDGGNRAGEAYVIYGKAGSTRGTVDLTGLAASDGFIIQGDAAGDQAGWSVSGAGDVNGDDIDDLIVGARLGDDGDYNAGEAYIIYGKAGSTRGMVDLTGLAASDGFIIQGDSFGDQAGRSVSGAGDINGDGIDDLIVGAPFANDGSTLEISTLPPGEAYVIYGKAGTTRGTIDVTGLDASDGFVILSDILEDRVGLSVSGAGDINGDGIADLIIGADGFAGGPQAGDAYVIYGKAGMTRAAIDLTGIAASDGFLIKSSDDDAAAGHSVSAAGDVNGDGIDDLIVGAPYSLNGGSAYVIYGMAGATRGTVNLVGLSEYDGFIVQGDAAGDGAGFSVSGVGDANGDGIDDLIVGAPSASDGGIEAGVAYVIYGSAPLPFAPAAIDLTTLIPARGFIVQGDAAGDNAGFSVSDAGDINGDGIGDFIVGAPDNDAGGANAGAAYVVYGRAGTTRTLVDLTTLAAADGFVIQGDAAGDRLARGVSGAGDVNGDGIDDLVVGTLYGNDGGTQAGEAYVIYGKTGSTRTLIDLTTLAASDGFIIQGDVAGDYAGRSVSGAGDVNGDGIDDLIIGADGSDLVGNLAGQAIVIYGRTGTRGTLDLSALDAPDGFRVPGVGALDFAGFSVSGAGDVNGDGINDLIIGAYGNDAGGNYAGAAYVIYGRDTSTRPVFTLVSLTGLAAADGFVIQGDAVGDVAGRSVSGAGDVNGDGIDDLIIGAKDGDDGDTNAGEAYVVYGKTGSTRGTLDLTGLAAADGFIIQGDRRNDFTGVSVSGAGDVNGDGVDDLIIGADGSDRGGNSAGEAIVIFGRTGTRGTLDLGALTAADGFVVQGDAVGDAAGRSVSRAGDVNGDGVDDLLIGAPLGDDGGADAGEAYVIYGVRASPFSGGNDIVINTGTNDAFDGAGGFDQLDMSAFTGAVTLNTAAGTIVSTEGGTDTVTNIEFFTLGSGDDIVTFGNSGFVVRTGAGDDRVTGGTGRDLISGGDGDDFLDGGSGVANELGGGDGNDFYVVSAVGDTIIEAVGGGTDTIQTSLSVFVNRANIEQLAFSNDSAHVGIGRDQDEAIIGNLGADSLFGRGGNDQLFGGEGAANTLLGQDGDDTYIVTAVGDTIIENAGEGIDTVQTSLTVFVLRDNVEILNFTATDNATGIGSSTDNQLNGNDGDDFLSGLDGDDILTGGAGLDLLIGGDGADIFRIGDSSNSDRILDFVSGTDKIALSNFAFSHSDTIDYVAGTAATSANSSFLYNSANGVLSFDSDGSGIGTAIAIANLGAGLSLTANDFIFYGDLPLS